MQIQNGIFDLHKFIIIFRYYRTGVFNPTYPFTAARIAITILIIMNAPASFTLLKEQLVDVLSTLTPREEKVLKLRFGIEDGRTRTLEEVGKEFNVTRERIRQIEAKALRKLRHPSRSKKLKDFLN